MTSGEGFSLSDLGDSRIGVSWFEAVAVVRSLAETVSGRGLEAGVPPSDCVRLLPDGSLQVFPAPDLDEHPVMALAGLLRTFLRGPGIPVELELLCLRNVRPPLAHANAGAFADALSFFERPDREAVLTGLHQRVQPTAHAIVLERDLERAQREAERAARAETERSARPAAAPVTLNQNLAVCRTQMAVATASFLLVTFFVLSLSPREAIPLPNVAPSTPSAPARAAALPPSLEARPVTTQAGGYAAPSPSWPTRDRGQERNRSSVRTARVGASKPLPSVAAAPTRPSRERQANLGDASQQRQVQFKSGAAGSVETARVVTSEDGVPTVIASGDIERITVYVPSQVYTEADTDVTPPVIVRQQIPDDVRSERRRERPGMLELVVNEGGTVDHVRLVSPSNRYQDRMLVAAAKAWLFQPARKDATPVKYRLRVRITS